MCGRTGVEKADGGSDDVVNETETRKKEDSLVHTFSKNIHFN